MNTTAIPGRMSGSTICTRVRIDPAPSIQAACSSSTGTPSMKFFIIQIAIGSALAVRKRIVPPMESMRFSCTKRL